MSRKTIPFNLPPKSAPTIKATKPAAELEQWVNQAENSPAAGPDSFAGMVAPEAQSNIVITLSATPNLADLIKLGALPYTMFWTWTMGAMQKSFHGVNR